MFNLRDQDTTRAMTGDPRDRVGAGYDDVPEAPDHPLDSQEMRDRHMALMELYREELDLQAHNRFQMAQDEAYYDHDQWDPEEAEELKKRGQVPIVYNVIATTINWIIGSEKRSRTDFNVLPRRKSEAKAAERKTGLLKYLADVNRQRFNRSRAFECAVKAGLGWLEDCVQDEDDGEPIYSQFVSWRSIIYDSRSQKIDSSDMRYIFRMQWVDLDIAVAMFPDRKDMLERCSVDSASFGGLDDTDGDPAMDSQEADDAGGASSPLRTGSARRRVRLIEGWYRNPETVEYLSGGTYKGEIFDPQEPRHSEAITTGISHLAERPMMRIRVCIMCSEGMIAEMASPYRHNRLPFTPVWGYRRGSDGLPYGVIRGLRDIQDDINKRASKAQYILATNKVIMEEGAIEDMEAFQDEVSRPDAIIVVKQGKKLDLNVDRDLAPAHLDMMSRGIQMVQQVGGVTDENLGRRTNATSGIAIQARQEQGSVSTNTIFDNLHMAVQMQGEIQLSLIEQYVTGAKEFRLTNSRGNAEFVEVNNASLPESDITRTKADFIVSEQEWRASLREAAVEQLVGMLKNLPPQVSMVVLDLVVDSMDIPNREEIVKRIRAVNQQRDPDQDEPTPEEVAAQQAQQKLAQAQEAMFGAELAVKQADAMLKSANAELARTKVVRESVAAANEAMQAGTLIAATPAVAAVGDALLEEAGWDKAKTPVPPPGAPPQQPPPPAPAAALPAGPGGPVPTQA